MGTPESNRRHWGGLLPAELHALAEAEAQRLQLTRSELVRRVFARYFGDESLAQIRQGRPPKDDPENLVARYRAYPKVSELSRLGICHHLWGNPC